MAKVNQEATNKLIQVSHCCYRQALVPPRVVAINCAIKISRWLSHQARTKDVNAL